MPAASKSSAPSPPPTPWTNPQRAAIDHTAGDLLVSAAAGSGKTAVLAERCAQLVSGGASAGEGRCGVENLLVLTFTEAAANEMRTRIGHASRAKLQQQTRAGANAATLHWLRRQAAMVDRASISTLHAFCSRVLRQHFHEANVDPAFEVMDADEARLLQDEVLDDLLARWHHLPADAPQGRAFADFFEAYAQGRDGACRDIVLSLHRMLASTADPEKYRAAAREVYSSAEGTLDSYIKDSLARELHLAAAMARRCGEHVAAYPAAKAMLVPLQSAAAALAEAHALLATQGIRAWKHIPGILAIEWPHQVKTINEIPNFETFKKSFYFSVKSRVQELKERFDRDPQQMLQDLKSLAPFLETLMLLTEDFDAAFTAAKRSQNRLDFADLERLTLQLLHDPAARAVHDLRSRYHYLLVDEYQDINPLQSALLSALRSPEHFEGAGNLFLVGDVKQSIYGFRLADPGQFHEREQLARQRESDSPATKALLTLPHNFRSHPNLIAVMNALFEKMLTPEVAGITYHDGHALKSAASAAAAPAAGAALLVGTPVEVHLVATQAESDEEEVETERRPRGGGDRRGEHDSDSVDDSIDKPPPPENLSPIELEARVVADRIASLMNENRMIAAKDGPPRKLAYKDIAILLRAMRNKAMIFARALSRRGIPVHADLSTGFFDTPEVRDTLALLQTLDNPQQDIPLATVMLGPYGRFTHDDLALIRLTFEKKEVSFSTAATFYRPDFESYPDAGRYYIVDAPAFSHELAGRLRAFFAKLSAWRELLRSRPLHEGLAQIFAESKILAYVAGLDTGSQRIANLQMLHERALKFASFRKQGLHRFLRFIEGLRDQDGAGGGDFGEAPVLSEASDVVRIMSVHKSKGLEFPVVVLAGLGAKFNLSTGGRRGSGAVMVHRDLGVGMHVADIERNVYYPSPATLRISESLSRSLRAEELRLLYVAITRARDALILTGHITKASTLEKHRDAFRGVATQRAPVALPEDLLLKAVTPLDWLLPALAAADTAPPNTPAHLAIHWDAASRNPSDQVRVTLHPPQSTGPESAAAAAPEAQQQLEAILAGEPLPPSPTAADPRLARLLHRVTGVYSHDAMTRQPAVQTVTFLKTRTDPPSPDQPPPTPPPDLASLAIDTAPASEIASENASKDFPGDPSAPLKNPAAIEAARLRGIATHRLLQLLDFAACDTPAALAAQIQKLIESNALTPEESDHANWRHPRSGIFWFLFDSSAGQRLRAAAKKIAAAPSGDFTLRLRREISFTTLAPSLHNDSMTQSPADSIQDTPTLRGVIDVLLVDTKTRTAEIFDYKTDSTFLYQSRLDDYQRQMHYYLAAATEILGFAATQATLLFLSPQREHIIPASPPP